jgi:GNAT superfamily N-acetyltransferase
MTVVREARSSDLGSIVTLLLDLPKGTNYEGLSVDTNKMREFLAAMLDTPAGKILVLERDDQIAGVLIGSCQEWWFGHDLLASVMTLYVAPSARSGVFIKRMVERFETWAVNCGATRVMLGVSSGAAVERKGRLLGHFGYKASGGLYTKDMG